MPTAEKSPNKIYVEHLEREDVERAGEVGGREQERGGDALRPPARVPRRDALQMGEGDRLRDGGEVHVGAIRTEVGTAGTAVHDDGAERRTEGGGQLRSRLGDDALGRDPPRHDGG